MDWTTLRGKGKIGVLENTKRAKGYQRVNNFLSLILEQFAIEGSNSVINGHNFDQLPAFAYKERQVHSILSPSFSKIVEYSLMEAPVSRKFKDESNSRGWVDYFCKFDDSLFFIEVKHDFINLKSETLSKTVIKQWIAAEEQLAQIQEEIANNYKSKNGVFRIVLHVLVFHDSGVLGEKKAKYDYEELGKKIFKEFNPTPNWIGLWKIDGLLETDWLIDKEKELVKHFPCVMLVANIVELKTRKK